jgi:primary-amine oxidase
VAIQLPETNVRTGNPLEPLSADEIRRTSQIIREQRELDPKVRFVSIALHEPPKPEVLAHDRDGGPAPERAAFVVLYDRATSRPSRRSSRCRPVWSPPGGSSRTCSRA